MNTHTQIVPFRYFFTQLYVFFLPFFSRWYTVRMRERGTRDRQPKVYIDSRVRVQWTILFCSCLFALSIYWIYIVSVLIVFIALIWQLVLFSSERIRPSFSAYKVKYKPKLNSQVTVRVNKLVNSEKFCWNAFRKQPEYWNNHDQKVLQALCMIIFSIVITVSRKNPPCLIRLFLNHQCLSLGT